MISLANALLPGVMLARPMPLPSIVAGPYLQLAYQRSAVVIQVIQRGDSPITIKAGNLEIRPLPSVPLKTPNTFVRKFLVQGAQQDFDYTITVQRMPRLFKARIFSSGTAKVVLMGDSGRGLRGQQLIADQLLRTNAHLLVHVGDIVYPHGREIEYFRYHFPYYNAFLQSTPSVAAAGNHDTAYRDLKKYPDGLAYYRFWNLPQPKLSWAKDVGNFSFRFGQSFWVILDSNTYNNWPGKASQAWLASELKKGEGARWKFVAFHHPPFHSSDKKKNEVYMKAIAPILEKAKVNAVFSGHVHNYQRTKPVPGKPVYFVTGAGGAELYDQKIAADPKQWKPFTAVYKTGYSFTSLEFDRNQAVVRQINSKGQVIDQIRL